VSHWSTTEDGNNDPIPDWPITDCQVSYCGVTAQGSASGFSANEIGFGLWCHAANCPANSPSSIFGPAGSANVYWADITVDEPYPPSLSAQGSLWPSNGWVSVANGGGSLLFNASDPAGVCDVRAVITDLAGNWQQANDQLVGPDFSQGRPCPDRPGYWWSPNVAALADGRYDLFVQADNPAGMWRSAVVGLAVDNSPPSIGITSQPAARWYNTPQHVTWSASDSPSGVSGLACSDGGGAGSATHTMTVSAQGVSTVTCNAIDNASNWGTPASTTIYLDYQTPSVSFDGPSALMVARPANADGERQ
jgi:hypothetical protein